MKKLIFKCTLVAGFSLLLISCDSNKTEETSTSTDLTTTDAMNADTGMHTQGDNTMNDKMAMDTGMHSNMNSTDKNAMSAGNETQDFIMKAAGGGMMEVEMGKLAQKTAMSKEVKDFGKMMETDHTKANNDLKKIADAKNIAVPAAMPAEHGMHMTEMQAKTGSDFDKAYITMMVEDHNKDIDMYKKAAASHSDSEIKSFASKTLPVLERHLAKAKTIQAKM